MEGVGTLMGAGVAADSMIGGNTAVNIIGGIGGAIVGGIIGGQTEEALTKDTAYEFLIHQENSALISVVQTNELNLKKGESVFLSTLNDVTRICERATF